MFINRGMDKEDVVYTHTHTHTHTMEYYSAIKKNETRPFVPTWMGLESVILSEVSQMEKENYHMTSFICGIEKEMIQMNLLAKQKETHRLRKQSHGHWGWRGGWGLQEGHV